MKRITILVVMTAGAVLLLTDTSIYLTISMLAISTLISVLTCVEKC
jgi:hypothetical protein